LSRKLDLIAAIGENQSFRVTKWHSQEIRQAKKCFDGTAKNRFCFGKLRNSKWCCADCEVVDLGQNKFDWLIPAVIIRKAAMNKMLLPLLALMLGSTQLPAQPVITNQPTNQIVLNGSNVSFSVTVSGTWPFTYQWQFNRTNLPNALQQQGSL
jgi:hypothetical protein